MAPCGVRLLLAACAACLLLPAGGVHSDFTGLLNERVPPAEPLVGLVQDCGGPLHGPTGSLCGAKGAYRSGHYVWVAASAVDSVTAVDVYRGEQPTVSGTARDPVKLKAVVAVWAVPEYGYVVALAHGAWPSLDGRLTLIDTSPARWRLDASRRPLVTPLVGGSAGDCSRSSDPTFPRLFGSLCGASDLAVVSRTFDDPQALPGTFATVTERYAVVAAEETHTLSVWKLPADVSEAPTRRSFAREPRLLDHVQALAVVEDPDEDSNGGFIAWLVTRHCQWACVVRMTLQGDLMGFGAPAAVSPASAGAPRLQGVQAVARGAPAGRELDYVTDGTRGALVAVDAACVDAAVGGGAAVEACTRRTTRQLYAAAAPLDSYHFRANAEPNVNQ